jgi:hypothetical protein
VNASFKNIEPTTGLDAPLNHLAKAACIAAGLPNPELHKPAGQSQECIFIRKKEETSASVLNSLLLFL